ncbi:acylphosphatase [uncultured Microbacterium sp.]|uniref:acylphosphatase n=1 Tax=uncultured Microbacterium sp. TaxID=191216 RepID=UPI0025E9F2B0|nr:acylphosphatase [uncultured Microbacterium sp.]
MRTVTITVSGRVQGVGFRYALQHEATRRGIAGWVRNLRDGRVEARLAGDADAVEDVIAWAHEGPPAAAVDDVDVLDEAAGDATGFEIRPTV